MTGSVRLLNALQNPRLLEAKYKVWDVKEISGID